MERAKHPVWNVMWQNIATWERGGNDEHPRTANLRRNDRTVADFESLKRTSVETGGGIQKQRLSLGDAVSDTVLELSRVCEDLAQ
ncbi:hypothetical protein R1flu_026314 [Riccia fluitans]|uniref:Uncharacterized protein n=1 Tax=Riccia fluitans TaxID=41844 RepID=A0ABD1XIJ0_9MARC